MGPQCRLSLPSTASLTPSCCATRLRGRGFRLIHGGAASRPGSPRTAIRPLFQVQWVRARVGADHQHGRVAGILDPWLGGDVPAAERCSRHCGGSPLGRSGVHMVVFESCSRIPSPPLFGRRHWIGHWHPSCFKIRQEYTDKMMLTFSVLFLKVLCS